MLMVRTADSGIFLPYKVERRSGQKDSPRTEFSSRSLLDESIKCPGQTAQVRFTIESVSQSFEIGPVHVGGGQLFLIAGPCVIESEAHVRTMAEAIQRIAADLGIPYILSLIHISYRL